MRVLLTIDDAVEIYWNGCAGRSGTLRCLATTTGHEEQYFDRAGVREYVNTNAVDTPTTDEPINWEGCHHHRAISSDKISGPYMVAASRVALRDPEQG